MPNQDFDFQLRTRIVSGEGAIRKLGSLAVEFNAKRVLVVSDPGVVDAGLFAKGYESLQEVGLIVQGFHGLTENPSTKHVSHGLAVAREFQPDLLVGLGGGSSMDCTKGINFIYSCGGVIKDYWGVGKAPKPMLPMIAVPTTAGTGSETQSFALISDEHTHVKMACGDPKAAFKVTILDPSLTITQPRRVTALTGIDALTHALETFVTNKRNAISECFSREAWSLLAEGFPRVISNPTCVRGREQMQLGASFAGMAIEASMLGAAHATANPLTASLGTAHGQAVGMMMPHVVRFNASVVGERYEELASMLPDRVTSISISSAADFIADRFVDWLLKADLKMRLRDLEGWSQDVLTSESSRRAKLGELAASAAKQWTGSYNPRPVSEQEYFDLYLAAW